MNEYVQMFITIICSVLASSGFWAFMQRKSERNSAEVELLIGLGHDRIVSLGMSYLERGWLTEDEYENLHDYLFVPYEKGAGMDRLRGSWTQWIDYRFIRRIFMQRRR